MSIITKIDGIPLFSTKEQALRWGKSKGVLGHHEHTHFGQKGYDDWRSGTATKEQRKSYLARAKGIRNKEGKLTWKDKNTANYWAVKYLW